MIREKDNRTLQHTVPAASGYEQSLDLQTRKAGGIYYTPSPIIRYILNYTVEQADVTASPFLRILDPACGSGLFLLAAYDVLFAKFKAALASLRSRYADHEYELITAGGSMLVSGGDYWQEENLHRHLLRYCLFGADSDEAALAIAAAALSAKSAEPDVAANLLLCDSLMKWEQDSLFASLETQSERSAFWSRQFDYVIGNPPYIPVTRMNAGKKAYYRANYQCAAGRINTFALFVERAIEKAAVRIGLIVPSRLLLNTQYGAIRRHILSQTILERIYEAKEGVFDDAVVDTVVVIMAKDRTCRTDGTVVIERGSAGAAWEETVSVGELLTAPDYRISFMAGSRENRVLDRLENHSVALADIAEIRDGIIQGAVGAELFLGSHCRSDARCKPVLSGHMIEAYACRWQNQYIWYDPDGLTALEASRTRGRGRGLRLRSPAVFEHPKILSRQTADHIIAAMDEQGYYYMNTLHGTTVTDPAFDPWYVLAVMNSALIRCWYAWRFAETGRSFAQVKIASLRKLPVLRLKPDQQEQLAALARQAAAAYQSDKDCRFLLNEIDDILYSYSSLDQQAVQIMREFNANHCKQTARRRTRRGNNVNTID